MALVGAVIVAVAASFSCLESEASTDPLDSGGTPALDAGPREDATDANQCVAPSACGSAPGCCGEALGYVVDFDAGCVRPERVPLGCPESCVAQGTASCYRLDQGARTGVFYTDALWPFPSDAGLARCSSEVESRVLAISEQPRCP